MKAYDFQKWNSRRNHRNINTFSIFQANLHQYRLFNSCLNIYQLFWPIIFLLVLIPEFVTPFYNKFDKSCLHFFLYIFYDLRKLTINNRIFR
jgi:hypothetical protein